MKVQTLKNIYNSDKLWGRCHNLRVKIQGYNDLFDVDLIDRRSGTPDCIIAHFGYNRYFRTPKGIKAEKYKTPQSLRSAIIKVAKNNNCIVEYFAYRPRNAWRHRVINL